MPMPGALELVRLGVARRGAVTVPVSGDSMMPTMRSGQRVLVEAIDPTRLRSRDVIAFGSREGVLVVHRVQEVSGERIWTAGDGLEFLDEPITLADVVGIVRAVPSPPVTRLWPPSSAGTDVDVWVVQDGAPAPPLPPGWRLHQRPRVGVGVSDDVLEELRQAVQDRPCVAVSERAVLTAADVLGPGALAGAQVLVGCSFGRLDYPMPGNLIPKQFADLHVRVGPPQVPLDSLETIRRLVPLVAAESRRAGG